MKLVFIRHGKTLSNLRRAYVGNTDESLCLEGIKELQCISNDVKNVFVTTKCRTHETAKILFHNADLNIIDGLEEMNFGKFECKNYNDLSEDIEYQKWLDNNCETHCPNGESKSEFISRVRNSFLQFMEYAESDSNKIDHNGTLYFVVHGGTIMALCSEFLPNTNYFDVSVDCGNYVKVIWNGKEFTDFKRGTKWRV